MDTRCILAVNAGSSSLKLALFEIGAGAPLPPAGEVVAQERDIERIAYENIAGLDEDERLRTDALEGIGAWCRRNAGGREVAAAAHRVVHGGAEYASAVVTTTGILRDLEALNPLAPLHQPHSLAPIAVLARSHPSLTQVACFDTAFHRGRPSAVERYGLPESFWQQGLRRYGFHGLSYEYVVSVLRDIAPELAAGRVIIAHLGSGASLCAVDDGRSVDTTMGFSTLDGLVMSTRCGSLDPGAVLHLLRDGTRSVGDVERLLYRESGLKGISGISGDMRDLVASDEPSAREAIDCFVLRIVREIGALTAMLGGLDGLVFTAGIGENSAEIRAQICRASAWTGLALDEDANARGATCISTEASSVAALVIATDEERMIARHARALVV